MDWLKVADELERHAKANEEIVENPYKHQAIKQTATTVATILYAQASALRKGVTS